jgi:outer membrane protein TolC
MEDSSARRGSDEEIEVLREHIKFLEDRFKRVDALFQSGNRGGSVDRREMTAYELARAQGELALVQGKRDEALEHLENARQHAEKALRAVTAAYEAGQITHDILLQAANNVSAVKRRLVQVKNPPTESAVRAEKQVTVRNADPRASWRSSILRRQARCLLAC